MLSAIFSYLANNIEEIQLAEKAQRSEYFLL